MKKIPIYTIDCSLPPESHWDALPKYLRKAGRTIARRGNADLAQFKAVGPVASIFRAATKGRNPYRGEMRGAARALGISFNEAVAMNFSYEINQLICYFGTIYVEKYLSLRDGISEAYFRVMDRYLEFIGKTFACTAGAVEIDGKILHIRSLDWFLPGLGRHTCIMKHINNTPSGEPFWSVGWPGFSGVLSGYKPGAFSISLNMAPNFERPTLAFPPSHLIRWVLENCSDYSEALDALRNTPVCVLAFILLASPTKAAVIEMGSKGNVVHRMKGGRIAVANDYLSKRQREADDPDSDDRREALLTRMSKMKKGGIKQAIHLLQADPLEHAQTVQQMAFDHRKGAMMVIGRENDEPVAMSMVGQ